jgi:hypothetical protein
MARRNWYCDGIKRRDALKIGGTGLFGSLSLPSLLQMQAEAATTGPVKAKSIIFLFLEGGPSTIDMWDMKPDAPSEIRGPFKQIPTKTPGLFVGEHLPLCAKMVDKFTMLRSHSHNDNGHTTGYHYCMTGRKADFPDGNNPTPNNNLFPSMGSVVSRELGPRGSVPCYINLPSMMAAGGPGFYGAEHAPFVIESDPVQPDFQVKDLPLVAGINRDRFKLRRKLLDGLEDNNETLIGARGRPQVMGTYYDKAYDLITSPAARKAFAIQDEPEKLRQQYGYTSLGQCALLSRRLVEAGCRFVGVDHGSWDTHFSQFVNLKNDLIPHADHAFSTLVNDLDDRGMLDSTLVVMMGEMGRMPRINNEAGRDHWSMSQTVIMAGGGIKRGAVVGATDKQGSAPITEPFGVNDLLKTFFYLMGIDSTKSYLTPLGRPVPILDGGKIIQEILA